MRLLVLTPEIKRASYRLRIHAVLSRVAGLSFESVELPRSGPGLLREIDRARDFDAVLLHKRLLEPGPATRLRACVKRLYYDVDDAVMSSSPDGPGGWLSRWKRRRRFAATASVIDVAVAGNEHLARLLRERGVHTVIVPTTVDPADYVAVSPGEAADAAHLRVVWVGSSSTMSYLATMVPSLAEAAGRFGREIGLHVVADRPLRTTETTPGLSVTFEPWSEVAEKSALAGSQIGIAPTPDDPWTRGKCGFKIIQYMAAGLPVIASPVGANAEIVTPGSTGLHATTPTEWTEAILRLANDRAERARMGAAGRARVESHYSIAAAASAWENVLHGD